MEVDPKMVPVVQVNDISEIKCIANYALVENLNDSVTNYCGGYKGINIVMNESSRKKEGCVGKVIKLPKKAYVMSGRTRVILNDELDDKVVIYNIMSRMCKIEVLRDDREYYLVRVPDIVAVIS